MEVLPSGSAAGLACGRPASAPDLRTRARSIKVERRSRTVRPAVGRRAGLAAARVSRRDPRSGSYRRGLTRVARRAGSAGDTASTATRDVSARRCPAGPACGGCCRGGRSLWSARGTAPGRSRPRSCRRARAAGPGTRAGSGPASGRRPCPATSSSGSAISLRVWRTTSSSATSGWSAKVVGQPVQRGEDELLEVLGEDPAALLEVVAPLVDEHAQGHVVLLEGERLLAQRGLGVGERLAGALALGDVGAQDEASSRRRRRRRGRRSRAATCGPPPPPGRPPRVPGVVAAGRRRTDR